MKVSRWGNSLAVRLPAELVKALDLNEGDYVEQDQLALIKTRRRMSREEALEVMRHSRLGLPAEFKFDRDEANER